MRVRLSVIGAPGGLAQAPPEIELPEGATVADALALLGVKDPSSMVTLLDGGPSGPGTPLRHGSLLELMPIVEGG